jgi:glutathione S-transferase
MCASHAHTPVSEAIAPHTQVQDCKNTLADILRVLDGVLLERTFFVGDAVTLADISLVCTLAPAFVTVRAHTYRRRRISVRGSDADLRSLSTPRRERSSRT